MSLNTGNAILSNAITVDGSYNVGIGGAVDASYKLKLTGASLFTGDLTLNNGNADGAQLVLTSSGFSNWNIDNYSGNFRAYYGSTEYMRLDSVGSLGLGTTPPTTTNFQHLFVGRNFALFSGSGNDIYFGQNFYYNAGFKARYSEPSVLIATSNGDIQFQNSASGTAGGALGTTTKMLISSSGNVGIGTTDASHRLVLQNGTSECGIRLTDGTNNTYFALCAANNNFANGTIAGDTVVRATNGVCLAPNNGSTVAMRITSGGTVLIGGEVQSTGTGAGFGTQNREGSNRYYWIGYNAGMRLYNDSIGFIGTFAPTTGVYTANSDVRLKENITDSTNAINYISKLKVKSYDWKHNGLHESFGLIAQEVYEILPEYVFKPENEDDNWGISKGELVPMLIKAIQEQQAMIEAQQEQINQLINK